MGARSQYVHVRREVKMQARPKPRIVAAAIVCGASMILSVGLQSQGGYSCVILQSLENQARKVYGAVNAECSGSWHSEPYGNWGVDSNFQSRIDRDQFMGWVHDDGHMEWNSCSREFPPPDWLHYNADGGTTQVTTAGIGVHGVLRSEMLYTPCEYVGFEGSIWGSSGNFMSLWELDPGDADTHITTLYFPDVEVTLGCPTWSSDCYGATGWVDPIARDPDVATAQLRYVVAAGNEYIPW